MKATEIKAKILASNDIKVTGPLAVPEWGGVKVWLKTLTGTERDLFEESYAAEKNKSLRARMLVLCLCDESGERLFTDSEVAELGKRNANVLTRLFDEAWKANAFSPEAVDALGKDSPSSGQSAAST